MTEQYRPDGQEQVVTRPVLTLKTGYQEEGMGGLPLRVRMTLEQYLAMQGIEYHPSMLMKPEPNDGVSNGHSQDYGTVTPFHEAE